MAVNSYHPLLLELWRVAARREVRLTLPDKRTAINTRARLHKLRVCMRDEGHPWANLASSVIISIEDNVLIAHPADAQLLDALAGAGVELMEPPQDIPPDAPPPDAPDLPVPDGLFEELRKVEDTS